jgi:putative transposase
VGAYKSLVMNKWINHIKRNKLNILGSIWQRNYYEHIVRSENELGLVREYVICNSLKWLFDSENPECISDQEYSKKWQWLEGKK